MDNASRLAAVGERAAALIGDGMVVGLGTGSTAEAFLRALAVRVRDGLTIQGIPTSRRTEHLARDLGIPLTSLSDAQTIHLGIDGADEIDPQLSLTKGRGGALLYEKLIATACERWMVVAVSDKLVDQLGSHFALPIEIIPFGWEHTQKRVEALGFDAPLRVADDGTPIVTDGRHFIIDCHTGPIDDPAMLASDIKRVTGVVDHGLFVGIATAALICDPDGTVRKITPQ